MEFLNRDCLKGVSAVDFEKRQPYPWAQIHNPLLPEAYELLRSTLPPVEAGFDRQEGVARAYGQAPHDRYLLHYRPGIQVQQPCLDFIGELQGPVYQAFLRQMLGEHEFIPTFEWYYSWGGCGVS